MTKYVNITNRTDGFPGDGYGYFHTNGSTLHNFNLTRLNELNPALNFFKGDLGSGASKPASGVSSIRPMYVLAIEEEEDERSLPKVLLKLAISEPVNKGGEQRQQSSSGEQNGISAGIEYILDAKMDDLAPVLHNFQVNKSTGELFLIRPLDRDPPNGRAMWKFSVQARNRTTHYILAVADVLISVRDINDNKPLFEQKIYRTTLMENGPAGQILTKVTAIDFDDADMADNGKVVYSLLKSSVTQVGAASVYSGNPRSSTSGHHHQSSPQSISDYFQIDPHSGVLTALACCFDREKRPEYRLVARATDAGGLSDEATVVVSIGDLNDCPPKFTNPSRTLVLNDDSFSSFWLDQNSGEQFQEQPEQQGPILSLWFWL
ncbi:Cadherin, partial [Tyrophagus putrescentiae]